MIQYIIGTKGSGKTKWLIDNANEEFKNGNGNIAFVEQEEKHIFSLDRNIRLISLEDCHFETIDGFYGFLCGLLAMDYDLEKVYVDGIYKILDLKGEKLTELDQKLSQLDSDSVEIYINLDFVESDLPGNLSGKVEEVKIESI